MNSGLTFPTVDDLTRLFGDFPGLTNDCGEVKNAKIRRLLVTDTVGRFRVTGIKPAVLSLQAVFADIQHSYPDLWKIIGTEDMECYRRVRGRSAPSNHAAGSAIDLTVGGILPEFDADMIPYGFVVMYGAFHRAKWAWGAGYRGRRDPMHMEASAELLEDWRKSGALK